VCREPDFLELQQAQRLAGGAILTRATFDLSFPMQHRVDWRFQAFYRFSFCRIGNSAGTSGFQKRSEENFNDARCGGS